MVTKRIQRQIDRLFDEAEQTPVLRVWKSARYLAEDIPALDPYSRGATASQGSSPSASTQSGRGVVERGLWPGQPALT